MKIIDHFKEDDPVTGSQCYDSVVSGAGIGRSGCSINSRRLPRCWKLAITENLQREGLNAIETALSYKRLMDECGYTQEQVAERIGKERSTVTNYIRLLKLPPEIQVAVRSGQLSMGHARALTGMEEPERQLYVFKEIIRRQLSVRQTEDLVRNISHQAKQASSKTSPSKLPPAYQQIEDQLASHFSTRVELNRSKNGKGSIKIDFYSDEELDHIIEIISLHGR